jgi:hypothetical protein
MDKELFIENFRNAFGNYELPVGVWYSDEPFCLSEKTKGCFIRYLKPAREGELVSFDADTLSCSGGKVYTGFTEAPPFIPGFVSTKERYKETPESVTDFIRDMNMPDMSGKYLNFVSIDKVDNFDELEGLIFFATPDVLSGLISWVFYDTNRPDAVSVPFGSGCSSIVAQTVVENRNNGQRTFLGMFDPSVRPQVESNILSLAIPMSRFRKMYHTFNESCLQGTHAWEKVKNRIENGD